MASFLFTLKNQNIMMKNIKNKYARLHAPAVPGVYPQGCDFVVYVRGLKGTTKGKIIADRKFKIEEAAKMYFDGLRHEYKA